LFVFNWLHVIFRNSAPVDKPIVAGRYNLNNGHKCNRLPKVNEKCKMVTDVTIWNKGEHVMSVAQMTRST